MPEAHFGGGGTGLQYQAAWGHPFWPSGTPSCPSFFPKCFFSIKSDMIFFPDFISCKNSQGRDFPINNVRISSFIQIWKDPGANYEAKCLEKWMHFGCISSPKLSSLFVLKQLKRSAEAIKDFDKNFALHMKHCLIVTSIQHIIPITANKMIAKVYLINV